MIESQQYDALEFPLSFITDQFTLIFMLTPYYIDSCKHNIGYVSDSKRENK